MKASSFVAIAFSMLALFVANSHQTGGGAALRTLGQRVATQASVRLATRAESTLVAQAKTVVRAGAKQQTEAVAKTGTEMAGAKYDWREAERLDNIAWQEMQRKIQAQAPKPSILAKGKKVAAEVAEAVGDALPAALTIGTGAFGALVVGSVPYHIIAEKQHRMKKQHKTNEATNSGKD